MKHQNFFYNENVDEQLNEVFFSAINLFYNKDFFNLALKWFRCETDLEVIRAEIHEMEADFNNIETNATRVMGKKI